MSFLSKEKSNNYAVVNILLFVANLMIIILTYNNPLTMKWLMILYLVLGFAQLIFIVYIFIKNNVFNEDIKINSKIYVLYDNIASILIMVSIMILIFGNVFSLPTVDGNSMLPTLHDQQNVIVYKLDKTPKRGDIVIVEIQKADKKENLIKRVVAVPGDRVKFVADYARLGKNFGFVYINDVLYESKILKDEGKVTPFHEDWFVVMTNQRYIDGGFKHEVELPPNYYLVIGDKFLRSSDSRVYGLFHISKFGGKMIHSFGGDKDE